MAVIIEVKNITVGYGKNEVLKDTSFSIEAGDFIGLAGPNGSGKTTLVKVILGLLSFSGGSIKLFGKSREIFSAWGKIGYLPQKTTPVNPLFPVTVGETVFLGLLSRKKWPKKISKEDIIRAEETLVELGILELKNRMLSELSGGQQQKVMLARALVSVPEILIFDEPSSALDPESRESFFQIIEGLNKKKGVTIILITHDTGYIGRYANKLLYLDREVIYFGKFSDFCKSEKMRSYFGKYDQHIICHQHDL